MTLTDHFMNQWRTAGNISESQIFALSYAISDAFYRTGELLAFTIPDATAVVTRAGISYNAGRVTR